MSTIGIIVEGKLKTYYRCDLCGVICKSDNRLEMRSDRNCRNAFSLHAQLQLCPDCVTELTEAYHDAEERLRQQRKNETRYISAKELATVKSAIESIYQHGEFVISFT